MNGLIPERFSPSLRSSRYMILYLCPNPYISMKVKYLTTKRFNLGKSTAQKQIYMYLNIYELIPQFFQYLPDLSKNIVFYL